MVDLKRDKKKIINKNILKIEDIAGKTLKREKNKNESIYRNDII